MLPFVTKPEIPPGYEVHHHLEHRELIPFVQIYLRKSGNLPVLIYWISNLLILAAGIFYLITAPAPFIASVLKFSGGIAFFLLLIPLHELLHGLAYRLCGAPAVSYHAAIKKFMFYALADRFVIGRRSFLFVAFTPFVVINSMLILAIFFTQGGWFWFWWAALLMHTSGCAGDFALAGYFWENRQREPLTFDLKDDEVTVFLRREPPGRLP
jgi:hypothetical protein